MSDPQLRKDIAALTLERAELKARVLELESQPPKVIVKEVIKEVPGPVEVKRVEVPVIKEVPRVEYVTKEVAKTVKCPKQAAIIKELRAKLAAK